jgi:transcriptional regulator with XRE-family HTH domain
MVPGDRLREIRARHDMSVRDVSYMSEIIAAAEKNNKYLISSPWLVQIENRGAVPSVYKLFSLAAIYGITFTYLLSLYGLDLDKVITYHAQMPVPKTHLADVDPSQVPGWAELSMRCDDDVSLERTNLLSRMVGTRGQVPLGLIQGLDHHPNRLYGFVGTEDYTLYPLIRPGTFVEIDPDSRIPRRRAARTEFDRPIYFVHLQQDYACAWCEVKEGKLVLLTHQLSPSETRIVNFPGEAEIIGEVVAIAMRLRVSAEPASAETSALLGQS